MVLSSLMALGLVLIAMAATGISSLAGDLEAATPLRAPTVIDAQTREIDCPLPPQDRPRI